MGNCYELRLGAGWDEPGEEALAGRAFASGLASIQRNKVPGAGAKYRVSRTPRPLSRLPNMHIIPAHNNTQILAEHYSRACMHAALSARQCMSRKQAGGNNLKRSAKMSCSRESCKQALIMHGCCDTAEQLSAATCIPYLQYSMSYLSWN